MVGCVAGGVDPARAHARRQVLRHEHEIAGEAARPLHGVVQPDGRIVRPPRVGDPPRVAEGRRAVDEGLELLSGQRAGERGPDGRFPEDSFNGAVERALAANLGRLKELRAK